MAWSAFDIEDADLDMMGHPLLNLVSPVQRESCVQQSAGSKAWAALVGAEGGHRLPGHGKACLLAALGSVGTGNALPNDPVTLPITPPPPHAPTHPCPPARSQIYYSGAEIIPSALVLYILRKLPPKRPQQGYQQIPAQ